MEEIEGVDRDISKCDPVSKIEVSIVDIYAGPCGVPKEFGKVSVYIGFVKYIGAYDEEGC